MKTFKGCVNSDCKAYKKMRYKKDDQFCTKCGSTLEFVCAECWKPMEDDSKRYCISCEAIKDQKKAQRMDKFKSVGGGTIAVVGSVATVVGTLGKDAGKIADGTKKIADAGVKLTKIIKK